MTKKRALGLGLFALFLVSIYANFALISYAHTPKGMDEDGFPGVFYESLRRHEILYVAGTTVVFFFAFQILARRAK